MASLIHPASLPAATLLDECIVRRQRRSGPGGQHRNKVETAIVLVHQATGIRGEASERRSQATNLKMALRRLRVSLAIRVRSPQSGGSPGCSELWQSRVRGRQILVSLTHEDFPTLLAEALDNIAAAQFDIKAAGDRLGCTSSQIVKFLKLAPEALAVVNEQRGKLGMSVLR